MGFDVGAEAYGRFMGRYSEPLAVELAGLLGLSRGERALDVGCGPGALTAVLVDRLGASGVHAVDPSASFVAAARMRLPEADIREASADALPFPDDHFDVVAAQLVVHFLPDPRAGLVEMARVTRPGGVVAACVWDYAGGRGPLSVFWQAARDLDPRVRDESDLPGARSGHLLTLFAEAGLKGEQSTMTASSTFADVDEWWQPLTLGVGPAGDHVASLEAAERDRLRAHCVELLPPGRFTLSADAWTVVARV